LAALLAPQKKFGLPRVLRGSTNAGGEDVGYFVSPGKVGSNPAFDARTVEVPLRGDAARHSADVSKEAPVLPSLTPISPVPQRTIYRRASFGMAVVKMSVTSYGKGTRVPSGFDSRTPKGGSPERAATASPVPRHINHGPW
jgi:hypothetical protein